MEALSSFVTGTPGIRSTSGGGHAVEFDNLSGFSPADISAMWSWFVDLYDDCSVLLVSSGITTPTEDQIYAEMMDRLHPVDRYEDNFSGLREGAFA